MHKLLILAGSMMTGGMMMTCSQGDHSVLGRVSGVQDSNSTSLAPTQTSPSQLAKREAIFAERQEERTRLVARSIAGAGITDLRVLNAMRRVPRHRFVPEGFREAAYRDQPLPIGWGQTISQPFIVALMTEAVRIQPTDRCLEVGTGSGYQAAVLAELCAATYSIEYVAQLAEFAKANLADLGYKVQLRAGDGYRGWPEAAPFDVIVITAAPAKIPEPLLDQLADKGRLVVPVGATDEVQRLELWTRRHAGREQEAFARQFLADVRFVPFVGAASETNRR
jgi:protein-L-isoaspartate(D-aspartate) O-methyltransferase